MTRKIKNKGEVLAWSMYDFANQPFSTLVVTFIYGTFFTTVISENEIIGTKQWSYAVSFSAIVVAILSPLMDALADRGGYRKLFLIFFTYATIIFTILLYFILPGQVWQSLLCFSIANICFEMGGVFCNAYLPDISHSKYIGIILQSNFKASWAGRVVVCACLLKKGYLSDSPSLWSTINAILCFFFKNSITSLVPARPFFI